MIVTTTHQIPGFRAVRTCGLVRGSTIRTKHLGKDILARLRSIVGGEIHEYTKMMAQAREQAIDRMIEEAAALGANGVIGVHFQTSMVLSGASEILCYGTAVCLEPEAKRPAEAS
ncbi:MAG: YbjQ family protein [Gemmatimonadales bacterium]|nr:MAG: YbjQ family protein [Gemmatimonadales bacterium]